MKKLVLRFWEKFQRTKKKITTKSKVATKETEKSNIKSNENVLFLPVLTKKPKKISFYTKPKKPVDKKALENNVNKEKLE